jgi:hypothetical protein
MKQLSVFVENKVGTLQELCIELANAGANILGVLIVDEQDWSVVRIVVDDVPKAKSALQATGYVFGESDVLAVELDNNPGSLAEFSGKLAKEDINVEFSYVSCIGPKALVILSTSNNKKAMKVVK